jgi:hypothetical protein
MKPKTLEYEVAQIASKLYRLSIERDRHWREAAGKSYDLSAAHRRGLEGGMSIAYKCAAEDLVSALRINRIRFPR